MAYAAAITYSVEGDHLVVRIRETEAAAASVAGPVRVPRGSWCDRVDCTLVSGSGSTVNPGATRTAGGTIGDESEVWAHEPDAPAARVSHGIPFLLNIPEGVFHHQSRVSSGADNVVETSYHLRPPAKG